MAGPGWLKGRIAHLVSDRGPKLLQDLLSLVTGQAASMLLGFAAFAYLARVLDPEAYGMVEYAIAVAALAAIVIECGAGNIAVRELARRPEEARALATAVPVARFLLAIVVVPLAAASTLLTDLPPEGEALVWLYAISAVAVALKQDWMLQGFERMNQAAFAQPIRTGVFALGILLFAGAGSGGLIVVGVVELVSVAAVSAYLLWAQYRWTVPFQFTLSLKQPLYLIREGAAIGLSNALWAFMLYTPVIMLASLAGGAGPAWLGAAQRLVISMVTLSFIYHFNLYPFVAQTVERDPLRWSRVVNASCRLVAWGCIGFALGTTLLREEIMAFVFGAPFAAGGTALGILIWVFPLRTMTGHTRWSLIAAGHQKRLLYGEIAGALVLLAIGFAAIPQWGAAGGAAALVGGIMTSGIVTQFAINRLVAPLSLVRPALLPAVAAMAGFAAGEVAGKVMDAPPLLQTVAGMAVFGLVALTQVKALLRDVQIIGYARSASGSAGSAADG